MNRLEIFDAVSKDTNRFDKADRYPEWLAATQFRINENLRDDRMLNHVVLKITETVFPVPPDFQQVKGALKVRSGADPANPGPVIATLKYFPEDQMGDGFANPSFWDEPRGPLWFTTKGRQIELGGWNAAGDYLVDMWYFANLSPLDTDTATNWLSEAAPQIYISIMKHFAFQNLQEFDTADRMLMMGMGEIQAMTDRNENRAIQTGPLIARPTQGYGSYTRRRRR